jgi:mannose-6-phosphate isomerase-like protein (cupin superfamily)
MVELGINAGRPERGAASAHGGIMSRPSQAVITRAEDRPREGWDDPAKGSVAWHTLFSADITPTDALCAGIAILEPGGSNPPHRHAEAEIYLILEGKGVLTIDGRESAVGAGAAVFIPGPCLACAAQCRPNGPQAVLCVSNRPLLGRGLRVSGLARWNRGTARGKCGKSPVGG